MTAQPHAERATIPNGLDTWADAEASKIVGVIQDLSVSAADAQAVLKTTLLIAYHKGAGDACRRAMASAERSFASAVADDLRAVTP